MANPYEVRVPSALEALMAGEQGYKGAQDIMNQRALQEAGRLYAAGDIAGAQAAAARGGSLQALMGFGQLANSDRQFQFQQSQANRQQGNTDRQFALQKQQADEAARGFDYREVDDGAGGKALVRINKATGQISRAPIDGAPTVANNPYLPAGQMNESQSKDALYSNRMLASEKVLRGVENEGTSWWERAKSSVSDKTGYNFRGAEYQKFDQAQRDFINATLRRESGAVISPAEFDNANKQYFPMPGDTKDVIAQKRANRAEAIRGIGAGGGRGYRPESVISATGEITANPAAKATQPAGGDILAQAREAISKGAPRDAVLKRLQERGITATGL